MIFALQLTGVALVFLSILIKLFRKMELNWLFILGATLAAWSLIMYYTDKYINQ